MYKQGDPNSSSVTHVSPVGQRPGAKLEHLMERLEESRVPRANVTSLTLEDGAAAAVAAAAGP